MLPMTSPALRRSYERAGDDDRRWFDRHPERRYRLRPAVPAERKLAPHTTHVVVQQLRQNMRIRHPATIIGHIPDSDAVLARMVAGQVVRVARPGSA